MKLLLSLVFIAFGIASSAQTQKFDGIWEGKLNAGVTIRLVFEFKTDATGKTTAQLTSPDQSPDALPTDETQVWGDSISTKAAKFGIQFRGQLKNDTLIDGVFIQGQKFPLLLVKKDKVVKTNRPQTPNPPFNYQVKEVEFKSTDTNITLSGTLTLPKNDGNMMRMFPAVVLITGSGPQDRDETLFQHKPFAVIADYLTKRGFAVLRVDDRGVGKSTGNFESATSADFANDVEGAVEYLKTNPQINTQKIGLIGHSEGGQIAPMVASKRKDIKFIVLMAGPGIPITQLMMEQITAVYESGNMAAPEAKFMGDLSVITMATVNKNLVDAEKDAYIEKTAIPLINNHKVVADSLDLNTIEKVKLFINQQSKSFRTPWFKYFLAFDPTPYLEKLSCDVLAINGSKDIQVLSKSNLKGIQTALLKSKSKRFEVKEISGLNHLFQTCKECNVSEYSQLEESFSPAALEIIGNWLEKEK